MSAFPVTASAASGMPGWYLLGIAAGVAMSLIYWRRMAKQDARLPLIYLSGLAAGLVGAKLCYWLAEGWPDIASGPLRLQLTGGKTVLGGLAGGYAGVELAKKKLRYTEATGDMFALIIPLGVIGGRVGCLLHGCCPGRVCSRAAWYTITDHEGTARWPAVPLEIIFNLVFLGVATALTRAGALRGQRFHLYLISYGAFRFFHELMRDTPRVAGPFSGYALMALALGGFGVWAWHRRAADHSARSSGRHRIL